MKKSFHTLLLVSVLLVITSSVRASVSTRVLSYITGENGFILANQQTIIQLHGSYNGLSLKRRVKLVETRLQKITDSGGFKEELLCVNEKNGHLGLTYKEKWLVLADPASAYQQRMSQDQLVKMWREKILDMLPDISKEYMVVETLYGTASWYGSEFRGRRTANGERYDERYYTAAHRNLKFGAKVRVTNLENERFVIVTINDRGPWVKSRVIDLSWAAAKSIGLHGVGKVKVEILNKKD